MLWVKCGLHRTARAFSRLNQKIYQNFLFKVLHYSKLMYYLCGRGMEVCSIRTDTTQTTGHYVGNCIVL